jgi:hypothetical protein
VGNYDNFWLVSIVSFKNCKDLAILCFINKFGKYLNNKTYANMKYLDEYTNTFMCNKMNVSHKCDNTKQTVLFEFGTYVYTISCSRSIVLKGYNYKSLGQCML